MAKCHREAWTSISPTAASSQSRSVTDDETTEIDDDDVSWTAKVGELDERSEGRSWAFEAIIVEVTPVLTVAGAAAIVAAVGSWPSWIARGSLCEMSTPYRELARKGEL